MKVDETKKSTAKNTNINKNKKEKESGKKNDKKIVLKKDYLIVILIVIIIVSAIIVTLLIKSQNNKNSENQGKFVELDKDGNKVNSSNKLKEEKTFGNYKVKDATLKKVGNNTTFNATVTNNTNNKQEGQLSKIVFLDKNGKEVASMGAYIRELEAGEQLILTASISEDYVDIYDYKIVKK